MRTRILVMALLVLGVVLASAKLVSAYNEEPVYVLAKVALSNPVAIPNDVSTQVHWDTEVEDTANMVDLAVDDGRITITQNGIYTVTHQFSWAAHANGRRFAYFTNDDVSIAANDIRDNTGNTIPTRGVISATGYLEAGDSITVWMTQNRGGSLNLQSCVGLCYNSLTVVLVESMP